MKFDNIELVTNILKCLAHKERLKIVCYLIEGEKTVTELVELVGISQSQMSQFLKQLKVNKILNSKKIVKNGVAMQSYYIKDKKVKNILNTLKENYC